MENYRNDSRIVLTLDAGGTTMKFGAMKGEQLIGERLILPSNANDLDLCLKTMVLGFESVINTLQAPPVAISFAFPGPADYPAGIIGGYLPNFPSFRDGVALGPFLQKKFGIPVFINNDGDLFAYGEALGGALPRINSKLAEMGSDKRYRNLIGYTIGTGFGIGCVIDGRLNRGDNSCVETYCLPNSHINGVILEDSVAIRAIKRVYAERSGESNTDLTPKDISEIAAGLKPGNVEAAKGAFEEMGTVAGNAIAIAAQLMDGLVVIGGGISKARNLFMPSLLSAMRGTVRTLSGDTLQKVQMKVFDLDSEAEFAEFARGDARSIKIYGSDDIVTYDPLKRIGVTVTDKDTSDSICTGAYDFALAQLDAQ